MTSSYWVVIPAAGAGRRMGAGGIPKQYLRLGDRAVIEHAAAPFLADARCGGIVFALAADDHHFRTLSLARDSRVHTTLGGQERRDSVLAGLRAIDALTGTDPLVLVHDAARPCLQAASIAALLAAAEQHADGALLAVRISDTVKRSDAHGRVESTVARDGLWRAQTPQAFPLRRLMMALERNVTATDESAAMEAIGARPVLVAGSPENLKITEAADLPLAQQILAGGHPMSEQRVGFGLDVHAFGDGDHVWLGGVRVPHGQGIVAHSDGDVILHALCDALLENGIAIEHACEKSCACTTCHVILREGKQSLTPPEELEEDLLDKAWGLEPTSRLSCQVIVDGADLVIEIPKYTINMVSEGHH
jgi:2Fe-2S type ferredoxin (ISC system)